MIQAFGWLALALLCCHVLFAFYMGFDLSRRHKVPRLTLRGMKPTNRFVNACFWYAVVGTPVLGEWIWRQMRKLPPIAA
jgi:hypothetical protein